MVAASFLSLSVHAIAAPFTATLMDGQVEVVAASTMEALDYARDFDLTITATYPQGLDVTLPDMTYMRSRFQGFSVADGYERERESLADGKVRRVFRWRLVPSPSAERHRIRPFAVSWRPLAGGSAESRATTPVVLPPATLEDGVSGEPEINPLLVRMPPSRRLVLLWVLRAVLALLAVAAVLFAVRGLRRVARQMMMSPSERAMAELERLLGRDLPSKGLFKDFYVELTHVVRRYIERAHGLKAPRQTTEEFLGAATGNPDFTPEALASLSAFLHSADLVKFAGVGSSTDLAAKAAEFARKYILDDVAAMRRAKAQGQLPQQRAGVASETGR